MLKQSLRLITAALLFTSTICWTQTAQFILGGRTGIGVISPTVPAQVHGIIYSDNGGFKFPDGTIQISATPISRGAGTTVVNDLGGGNSSAAALSLIGSGQNNVINGNADFGVILGGKNNTIENQSLSYSSSVAAPVNPGSHNFISGGEFNTIKANANHAAIIGGRNNTIATSAVNTIILGGSNITATESNTVYMQKLAVTDLADASSTGLRTAYVDANGTFKTIGGGSVLACTGVDPFWKTDGNANSTPLICQPFIGTTDYNPFNIRTSNIQRMIVTAIGKVGIGTVDPQEKFEVSGSGALSERVASFSSEPGLRKIFFVPNLGGYGYNNMSQTNDAGIFWTDGMGNAGHNGSAGLTLGPWDSDFSAMRITSDGNVGLGVANPSAKLDVSGNGYFSGTLAINTASLTNPFPSGYQLAINGKVIAVEYFAKLTAAWPDYVFKKDYKLKDLNELKSYVKEEEHLPGIPSAKEVAESGVSLGDMVSKQMQKIEELTLYMIQLNEKVNTLQAENEKLKKNDHK